MTKPHFSILATSFAGGPRPRNAALILASLWLLLFVPPAMLNRAPDVSAFSAFPLAGWLQTLSMHLFGRNTFAAQLPHAITVALLALLGHRWANQAFGARTAFYTGVCLLTAAGFFLFTRTMFPDSLLALFLAAALFAFSRTLNPDTPIPPISETEGSDSPFLMPALPKDGKPVGPSATTIVPERPSIAWYAGPYFYPYVLWSSLAFAFLTSGGTALLLAFVIVLSYLFLTGTFHDWRRLKPLSGILLFLLLAAPWPILASHQAQVSVWSLLATLGSQRDPRNIPDYGFWLRHLIWLLPWSLFLPLGVLALRRRILHQNLVLTRHIPKDYSWKGASLVVGFCLVLFAIGAALKANHFETFVTCFALVIVGQIGSRRVRAQLPPSPFHRIDSQQRSTLLLALFAAVVLLFFSLAPNHNSCTLPAYLPVLLLISATITRAEQTYSTSPESRSWLTAAHATLMCLGVLTSLLLAYSLLLVHGLTRKPHPGAVLFRPTPADYMLAFASSPLPFALGLLALLLGPTLAWLLRTQRRHLAATTTFAFTSAAFLLSLYFVL